MKKASKEPVARRVYSYIRFSTPEQAMGDSERRQLEAAKECATRHGLTLDLELRMTDRGLSGYHGDHRKKGMLGAFLKMVEDGEVPKGSILYVEDIDRLSRETMVDAIEMIIVGLIKHDIIIETSRATYDRETLSGQIYGLIATIERAHQESQLKSDRGKKNWQQKRNQAREEGRILTAKCPAWLTVETDTVARTKEFKIVDGARKTIRTIFNMKIKGIGVHGIARTLNLSTPWQRPNGWHASYVRKVLQNRAVLGEYQPQKKSGGKFVPDGEPIADYFPEIVDPDKFHAVHELMSQNKGKGGQTGKAQNLFAHLVKCAYCGGPMTYLSKPKGGKDYVYLVCDRNRRGLGCSRNPVRYDECEKLILENCRKLQPDQVLPNPNEQTSRCQSLRQIVLGKVGQLKEIEQQLENLTDQVMATKTKSIRDRYEARMLELDEQKVRVEEQRATAALELREAETGMQSLTKWTHDLGSLWAALKADDVDLRLRLRNHLRDFIKQIEVFAVGHRKEQSTEADERPRKRGETVDRDGDDIGETFYALVEETDPKLARSKLFRSFVAQVEDRRQTKEGRFVRVHFKGGARVDLVPPGSLASGVELAKDALRKGGWRFVSPQIDLLWQQFNDVRQNNAKP